MPTYAAPGVYVEEVPSSQKSLTAAPTAIAAFVGFTATFPKADPNDPEGMEPRLVTSWTQYEEMFGGFATGCVLPLSIFGYFANGGQLAYVCRIPNVSPADEPSSTSLPASDRALGLPVKVTSIEPNAELTIVVEPADPDPDNDGATPFDLRVIEGGTVVEHHVGLSLGGDRDVAKVVNKASERVKVEVALDTAVDMSSLIDVMRPGSFPLAKATPVPVRVTGKNFSGSESTRSGINGLAIAEEVTMIAVPDLITAATKEDGTVDLGMWKAVQTALISHCEQQANRVAILDSPPGMTPQQVKEWRSDVAMYDSAFAAFYYRWIKVENPVGSNGDAQVVIPPSGHVAGVWARTDESRGVWKAPANDTMRGVLDIERSVSQNEQSLLNPIGVNCIRPFGTRGIRIWGARTLASDTDWTYISVRRLFNMVESTILTGTQWAVFEPNDVTLWEGVQRTVSGFLRGLWTAGALFGASADEAFYVKCDEETNPPESIDAGLLVVEVGIAPVKPAEFVIFRLAQFSSGSGELEE